MKKLVIRKISLPIAGLLGLGVIAFGAVSFSEHKKDNINVALAYEGTPLPASGTLSSGTYYISSDFTVSSQLRITSGDIIVNLNGHTLNGGGRDKGIFYVTGGTLTVNGKDDETGNRGALNNGGGYYPGSGYSYGGALYITAGAATFSDLDITNCQSNWGGAICMSNSAVTLNNCNLSGNKDTNGYGFYGVVRVGDSSAAGTGLTVNGGEFFSNDGAISVGSNAKVTINGAYIHDNENLGVRVDATEGLTISGNTIIKDNNSTPKNLVLNNNTVKVGITSPLGNDAYIGVTVSGDTKGVFTNSTDTSLNDLSKFFSDDSGYAVAKNDDGQLFLGAARTVTYNTEHGTAPAPATVASGSIILDEPTEPTEGDYVFGGWYKESTFENAWDFATDVVTSDITLYAKWYDSATANVIKLIKDIGDITYDGGVSDSQEDIIIAKTAYDALTPGQKADIDGVYKDVLDHDIVVYNHVDNAADLIKAIPEASNSQDYYDAVEDAKAAYYALADEEMAILNADPNFNYLKVLNDNVAAKEVIELINDIGDITYNGGTDDSLDDIKAAEDAYDDLSDEQKALVDLVNHDDLEEARETYDEVDDAINLIESIGDVSHGGASDSQEAIEAAREAYDSLTDEQKDLVDSYNDSGKTLQDDEAVYEAMEAIDAIGDVDYDSDSEEAIAHAREVYDSLTDDQKDQLGDVYLEILTDAEDEYSSLEQKGDILFIILIIVASLALIGGLLFLFFLIKKKKNEDDDDQNNKNLKKGQPTKVYSVGGLLPLVVLVSHYLGTKYIILYVVAGLAVLVWISCLILVLAKKKAKAAEQVKDDVKVEENVLPQNEDEEEVMTVTDEKGNIFQIRFIKSFTAKLIQSPEETKKYYEELKNEVLSYKKTNTRVSWHYDSINSGRNQVLKFAVRGKTLCVYFPLNADDYADSKYKVEKSESKRYEDVPCLYRIKNDRRLGYAKELIDVVCESLGLVRGEEQHESYANRPYEPNKPLIARGLIKELKVQVNRPSEPEVLESKTNAEGDEIVVTKDASGNIFEIRYIKSFTAKLSQSSDEVKDYYTELKNYALSYKKANSRVSWHYDSVNVGRNQVLKFSIRGKTLCLYYALGAEEYADSKYKVEKVESKKFEDVPCLYRIKNDRRRDYAKELIDVVMEKVGAVKGEESNEDYRIPYEETKVLLGKGLIKEVKTIVNNPEPKPVEVHESITVAEADIKMSDEKAESLIEESNETSSRGGRKETINIDTLSQHYQDGDEVTLDSLIKKKLVSNKAGYIKVLARGTLDKKLTVVLNDFSLQAVKMIVLVGGKVKKIR